MPEIERSELELIREKFARVTELIDHYLNPAFQPNTSLSLQQLIEVVYRSLNPESCCVFLARRDKNPERPLKLMLEAEYPPRPASAAPIELLVISQEGGGLTGHLATVGEIRSLCAEELDRSPYRTQRPPSHHTSGKCYSWLFIPLKDRKDGLIGVISVYNKLASDGKPNCDTCFDKDDILIAKLLASRFVPVLMGMRVANSFRLLMDALRNAGDLKTFLAEILKISLDLVGADRGDFAWAADGKLITLAQVVGDGKNEVGDPVPEKSIVHRVWRTGIAEMHANVSAVPDYYNVSPSTVSEIAVPVELHKRCLGVLNAESSRLFDQRDLDLLTFLAGYSQMGAEVLSRQDALKWLDRKVAEQSRTEVLRRIVSNLQDMYHFDSIIYIADYQRAELRCIESTLPKGLDYKYTFSQDSFANHIRKSPIGLHSRDPINDPRVNPAGLEYFDIHTSLAGLPLLNANKCWGVMVVYGSDRHAGPEENHLWHLEPFARLAATALALEEEQNRVRSMILAMQTGQAGETLRNVLRAIQQAGFDRVRIYRYDVVQDALVALDCVNMENSAEFLEISILMRDSEHSRRLRDHAKASVQAKKVVQALIFDPKRDGEDPHAKKLGKPLDLPWAVVPLVIAENFYGSISADNGVNRGEITADMLDRLTLLGAFAAQAIAVVEALSARDRLERERFVGDIIHRIKQPIQHVAALSESLAYKDLSPERRMARKELLIAEAKVLRHIAEQVHFFNDAGGPLTHATVDLGELVRNRAAILTAVADPGLRRIVTQLPAEECRVIGDKVKLVVALNQLLENAKRFAPEGSEIVLKLDADADAYRIRVIDEGAGVPPGMDSVIFEPAVSLRRGNHAGSGLGLTIARTIARLHGGDIELDTKQQRGACFVLTLPRPATPSQTMTT
jgi:signal transduction histidine kinase